MDKSKREILELLSRLYLLLAAIDHNLSGTEQNVIREKISEWAPDLDQKEIINIISLAANSFMSMDHLQIFNEISKTLNEYFDENNKISVLRDLILIARVDGNFQDSERKIISSLAEDWGVAESLDVIGFGGETSTDSSAVDAVNISRKAGSVFHDILTLLIYAGSESENGLTDTEWKIIYSGIVNFNLLISGKSFSLSKFKEAEISEAADAVIERLWGSENHPHDPYKGYQQSVKNILTYYKNAILDDNSIYAIIRLMLEVSSADGFIAGSQQSILEEIVKTFGEVPGVKKINDLVKNQLAKQTKPKSDTTASKPGKGGTIGISFEAGREPEAAGQPEIIADVYKEGGAYRAKVRGTGKDITAMIDDPEKLMRAYKQSGSMRGKLNKDGGYNWKVIRKKTE